MGAPFISKTMLSKKQYILGGGIVLSSLNFLIIWLPTIIAQIPEPDIAFPLWWKPIYAIGIAIQPTVVIGAYIFSMLFEATSWNLLFVMCSIGLIQFFLIGLLLGYIVYKIKSGKQSPN